VLVFAFPWPAYHRKGAKTAAHPTYSSPILNPSTTGSNVQTYPTGARFWHNDFTENETALEGTATVVDEPVGSGHAVLFSYNALFRAYGTHGLGHRRCAAVSPRMRREAVAKLTY
jgi:hypothetical protein